MDVETPESVTPAKAGVQWLCCELRSLDSSFRWNDDIDIRFFFTHHLERV